MLQTKKKTKGYFTSKPKPPPPVPTSILDKYKLSNDIVVDEPVSVGFVESSRHLYEPKSKYLINNNNNNNNYNNKIINASSNSLNNANTNSVYDNHNSNSTSTISSHLNNNNSNLVNSAVASGVGMDKSSKYTAKLNSVATADTKFEKSHFNIQDDDDGHLIYVPGDVLKSRCK